MSKADALRNHDPADDKEEPLWQGGFSGKAMYGAWLLAAIVSVVAIGAGIFFPPWGWVVGVGVAVLIWVYLLGLLLVRKWGVHYELTTQRLIHQKGILSRRTDRIELIDVDDVTYVQGIIQRMLGVGTVNITSSDSTHPELTMKGIDQVDKIADMIDDARRQERRKRGLHIEAV